MPRDTGAVVSGLAEELVVPQAYGSVTQQLAADASHPRVVHHVVKSCHAWPTFIVIIISAFELTRTCHHDLTYLA
jgi:hypothetical protein